MVPALPILGRVIDDPIRHLDLAGGVVPLKVGLVLPCVPQAELDGAEQRERRDPVPVVGDPRAPDLERGTQRDEVEGFGVDPTAPRADDRVAQAVSAAVLLEIRSHRLPRRGPELAARPVTEVEEAAAGVARCVVVPVPRQSSEPGIPVEGVPTGGVRDDAEEVLAPQVVDPGQRCVGARDDVLASLIVEAAVPRQWVSAACRSSAFSARRSTR